MTATTSALTETGTLDVPGARLHYELRGSGPLIALHAAPMDAASFAAAAHLLANDYTVVTSDPRGIAHSTVEDRERDVTPATRADDLARLLVHVDGGPVTVFGSSGGAVSALCLLQTRPELVSLVIAHEPPLAMLVDDRDQLRREHEDLTATYLAGDRRAYWTKFLRIANIYLPDDLFDTYFGTPVSGSAADDEQFAVLHMDMPTTFWEPDLDALRRQKGTLVIGIGRDSADQLCDRTSRALAARVGVEPTIFPGDHTGFAQDADAFAAFLRDLLHQRG
jgi:pimeloyl-ACP methyl ester carboxylesterase